MAFKMLGMSFGNEKKNTKEKAKKKAKVKSKNQKDEIVTNINGDVYDKKTILLNKDGEREF